MEILNRIYNVEVYEYRGDIESNEFCIRNRIIETGIEYSLNDAIKFGKDTIRNFAYSEIYKNIDTDEIPDEDISDIELEYFIKNKSKSGFVYSINIKIISCNRRKFNNCKELIDYFNNNIRNINNDNLYDFLLSFVLYEDIVFNYDGTKLISKEIQDINHFIFDDICKYNYNIDFNEEDCKKGIYTFEYYNY